MTSRNKLRVPALFGASALLCAASLLVACSPAADEVQYGIHGDRAVIYSDLDSMIADTSLVVSGVVAKQIVANPGPGSAMPDTISVFTVEEVHRPEGLAAKSEISAGQAVHIHQYGTADTAQMFPLLEAGGEYLLLLAGPDVGSEYSKDDPREGAYFITGQEAGLYQLDPSAPGAQTYVRVNPESGDTLPATLEPARL